MHEQEEPIALAYDPSDDELIAKLYTPAAAFECREAAWIRVEWCDGYEPEPASEGIRYAKSEMTGNYYRVTAWDERDGGEIVAHEKHEVDREEVPAVWLAALDEREVELPKDGMLPNIRRPR